MKQQFSKYILLIMMAMFAHAQESQALSSKVQTDDIERLKQVILKKDEEIKILLIALKNREEEKHAELSSVNLKFEKIQAVTPTKIVLTSADLSEAAIAEIDKESKIYKNFVPKKEELTPAKPEEVASRLLQEEAPSVQSPDAEEAKDQVDETAAPEEETVISPEAAIESAPSLAEPEVEAKQNYDDNRERAVSRRVMEEIPELTYIQPAKFKVVVLAPIYQQIGGEMYEEWDVDKTFTSNRRRGKWIMITGLITDKGWVKSPTTLWIQESFVKQVR